MLCLDVRLLAQHAAAVAGDLDSSDPVWTDADVLPSTPVHVTGRVSSAGGGRFYFSGHIAGTASQFCTRCVEPVAVQVSEDIRALFTEPGPDSEDDPDVYLVEPGTGVIDLRPAVREHWLLSVPRFVLCTEDCKGLCPRCGENLNQATCACGQEVDSRWDALRRIRNE